MEEDLRFWPPGLDPDNADNHDEAVAALIATRQEQGGAGSSLPPSQETTTKKSEDQERMETEFHTAHKQGHSDETEVDQGFSRDVVDVMRIATMCRRLEMGEPIWVSWVPKKQKPSRIGHGSTCLLMTKLGMSAVANARDRGVLKRDDADLVLKDWLLLPDEASKAHACYLYPPIGSYTEHPSECDPKNFGGDKTRPSGFDSGENPCHGTRLYGDPKGRTKAMIQWRPGWTDRPWIQFEGEAVLHSSRLLWKSFEDANAEYSLNNGEPTAAVEYVARSNKTTCWDGVKKGKLEADLRDWWKAADVETRQRHMVVDESNANMHKACVQAKRFIVDGTLEEWVDSQNVQKGINPVPAIVLQEAVSVKRRIGVEHPGNRQSSRRWLQRWAASTWNTASAWQCAGAPDARPDAPEGEAWSSPKIDWGVDWFWVARPPGGKKW